MEVKIAEHEISHFKVNSAVAFSTPSVVQPQTPPIFKEFLSLQK